jgi:HK97 gp10 family phage protein
MISVKVVKLDTRALDKMISSLNINTDQAISSIAFQVEGEAKLLSPVKTGALKNSIHTEKVEENTYIVGDGVEYGIYQELGTCKMAARPFLIPALEKVINWANKTLAGIFK